MNKNKQAALTKKNHKKSRTIGILRGYRYACLPFAKNLSCTTGWVVYPAD